MKVMITGAAGFIGSHLAEYYLLKGDEVVGIDNFCSSSRESEHFRRLEEHPRYEHYDIDISELDQCYIVLSELLDSKFDLILNFACPASPPIYELLSIVTINTCTRGLMNVLNIAYECGARVVHASTSEVYGDPIYSPQKENYWGHVNPYGPRGCYDNGKRLAETICYEYRKKFNLDVRMVRIFNTFGPHMSPDDGRVVTNFVKQALEKKPITVYGSGEQTRSFCYVTDLVDGITRLAALVENDGTPINIGNPKEFTINELAFKIAERIGDHGIIYKSLPKDDPAQRRPDISKAKELLNWEPRITLDKGLISMIDYMKKILNK